MDHLNGWVLVPSLQTLDRLIAELKRANRAWEQAFQVDLQAVRKLDVSCCRMLGCMSEC